MDEPALKIADYWTFPNRFEIASEWWESHDKKGVFNEAVLPKMAIFVLSEGEPICMLAADMSNSCGKAYIESGLTAPGLTVSKAREVLQFAERALFSSLKIHNYGLAQIFTSPALARTLEKDGWINQGEVIYLVKPIT